MSSLLDMFSPVDICFFICLLFGGIWGFIKGLSGELAQLGATIICFILSLKVTPFVAYKLTDSYGLSEENALFVAIVAVIFLCFFLLLLLRRCLQKILKVIIEVRYDRFFGFFAGIIHYGIMVILLILVIGFIPWKTTQHLFIEESVIGRNVMKFFPAVMEKIEENTGVELPLPVGQEDADAPSEEKKVPDSGRKTVPTTIKEMIRKNVQ